MRAEDVTYRSHENFGFLHMPQLHGCNKWLNDQGIIIRRNAETHQVVKALNLRILF
jgi:hypothetical protein